MLSREVVTLAGLILLTLAICYFTAMLGRSLDHGNVTAADAIRSLGTGLCTAAWFGGWWLCYRRKHSVAASSIETGEHVDAGCGAAGDSNIQELEPLRFRADAMFLSAALLLLNCMAFLLTVWLRSQWSAAILTAMLLLVAVHLVALPLSLVMRQGTPAVGFALGLASCLAILTVFDLLLLGQSLAGV